VKTLSLAVTLLVLPALAVSQEPERKPRVIDPSPSPFGPGPARHASPGDVPIITQDRSDVLDPAEPSSRRSLSFDSSLPDPADHYPAKRKAVEASKPGVSFRVEVTDGNGKVVDFGDFPRLPEAIANRRASILSGVARVRILKVTTEVVVAEDGMPAESSTKEPR
jgi:hypothetical protein